MIKSHETNEKNEESKDSVESSQKEEEERPRSPTPPPARKSPEPSCAICLEKLTNKSFTDSCFHMFCFTCLVEWSKVKPECPLCKKSFKSIVHNVRSFKDFDQYYIKSKASDDPRNYLRRFHYRTTVTPERLHDNSRVELEGYLSHRMLFAPHSVHSFRISYSSSSALLPSRRIPNSFRQRVYEENLWVNSPNSNRVRCISPDFFRQNIACTHRLLPWLNRDLLVVMNSDSQISLAIELIMALIVKYEIRSQEFRSLIETYTGSHTAHFIHEFYNSAISPYETLESYDQHAQYDLTPIVSYEIASSPDSDVIPLPMDYSSSVQQSTSTNKASPKRKKQSHPRKKHSKGSKKVKKIVLKRNSEKNVWEKSFTDYGCPPVPFASSSSFSDPLPFEMAGPSTSRGIPFLSSSPEIPSSVLDVSNDVECLEPNKEDDECKVVSVVKPRNERTPEIVNLSSDDELSTIVNDVDLKDKSEPAVISVVDDDQESNDQTLNLSDDECEILYCKESEISHDKNIDNEVAFDRPIDYSIKSEEKKSDSIKSREIKIDSVSGELKIDSVAGEIRIDSVKSLETKIDSLKTEENELDSIQSGEKKLDVELSASAVQPCSSSNICLVEDFSEYHKHISDPKHDVTFDRDTIIQSVVKVVTNEDTHKKPKKRRAVILDDASTESCSEGGQVSEIDTSKKKFKLKSVVAHYAFEDSDERESSHHSQHKKSKDGEKKKKKHKHRRRTRIYSSDSD